MWTDDHDPPVPTTQWKPGQVVEYTRTVFIPVLPLHRRGGGAARPVLGTRPAAPAAGRRGPGQRSYKVATLSLLPQSENVFLIFKDGWHPAEVATDNATVEWQWTKKVGTLAFRNPKKDVIFYLHADNPALVRRAADVAIKSTATRSTPSR